MPRRPRGSSWTREASVQAPGSSWTRTAAPVTRGSSWTRSASPSALARAAALLTAATAALVPGQAFAAQPAPSGVTQVRQAEATYLVRALPGRLAETERAVVDGGGAVVRRMPALETLSVRLTPQQSQSVSAAPGVASVVVDRAVRLAGSDYEPEDDANSLFSAQLATGVRKAWHHDVKKGAPHTGQGVDVALIDSGVSPVAGLDPSRIVNGPDLSFEAGNPDLRHRDTFGHGTHLAGIILGRDRDAELDDDDDEDFVGVAPSARLVSVKVADARGMSDVTQVVAAIDWVVSHRRAGGLDIRVLNLSFGTDSTQAYDLDPLAHAVEAAWDNGIVVVTSAGNAGSREGRLSLPAADPYVIAVGASDSRGTTSVGDDTVASFSSRGDGVRNPDLVAPGTSLQSLRVRGSFIDSRFGRTAAIDDRYFRGSGTSQSAAVVSGAAAVLLSQRPALQPDQVKALLTRTARRLSSTSVQAQGAGLLDLRRAVATATPSAATQSHAKAGGQGSIDASRGSARLELDGVVLQGEQDVFGQPYSATRTVALRDSGRLWSGSSYKGTVWTGNGFTGRSFASQTWGYAPWAGSSWAGSSWAGSSWASGSWAGSSWAGSSWAGSSWAGSSWAGSSWAGSSWAGSSWAGSSWG